MPENVSLLVIAILTLIVNFITVFIAWTRTDNYRTVSRRTEPIIRRVIRKLCWVKDYIVRTFSTPELNTYEKILAKGETESWNVLLFIFYIFSFVIIIFFVLALILSFFISVYAILTGLSYSISVVIGTLILLISTAWLAVIYVQRLREIIQSLSWYKESTKISKFPIVSECLGLLIKDYKNPEKNSYYIESMRIVFRDIIEDSKSHGNFKLTSTYKSISNFLSVDLPIILLASNDRDRKVVISKIEDMVKDIDGKDQINVLLSYSNDLMEIYKNMAKNGLIPSLQIVSRVEKLTRFLIDFKEYIAFSLPLLAVAVLWGIGHYLHIDLGFILNAVS